MKEEMDSLAHNETWDLVRSRIGKTTLQNKLVYKSIEVDLWSRDCTEKGYRL